MKEMKSLEVAGRVDLLLSKTWQHDEVNAMMLEIRQYGTILDKKLVAHTKGRGSGYRGKNGKKKEGGKKVLRCEEVIDDGKLKPLALPCKACITVIQSGHSKGPWRLDSTRCIFDHSPHCLGKAKPTKAEMKAVINATLTNDVILDGTTACSMLTQAGVNVSSKALLRQVNRATSEVNGVDMAEDQIDFNLIRSFCEEVRKNVQSIQLHSTTNKTSLAVAPLPPPSPPYRTAHQFMKRNPSSKASFGTGPDRKFKYLFVAIKPVVDLLAKVGLGQFFLDGTHLKHELGGTTLFIVGRDSNKTLRIPAFMICHSESTESYKNVALFCKDAGLGKLLGDPAPTPASTPAPTPAPTPTPAPAMFCNRASAMNAFFAVFSNLTRMNCVWHLIRNVRRDVKGKNNGSFEDNDIWKIQDSLSEKEFEGAMSELAAKNKAAEVYLRKIDRDRWVRYSIYPTHKVRWGGGAIRGVY